MAKVYVHEVQAFEGPAVQYRGDDGYPVGYPLPVLVAVTQAGKVFQRPNSLAIGWDEEGFQTVKAGFDLQKAHDIKEKIERRGFINAEHWIQISYQELEDYLTGCYTVGGL